MNKIIKDQIQSQMACNIS